MSGTVGSGGFAPPSNALSSKKAHDVTRGGLGRSSKPVPREEPRILLPTKVHPYNMEEFEDDDEDMNYPPTVAFQAYPDSVVHYTAQPVLKWVESLAAAAENAELIADESSPPIEVGGVRLSQRSSGTSLRFDPPPGGRGPFVPGTGTTAQSFTPQLLDASFLLEYDPRAGAHVQRMHQLATEIEGRVLQPAANGAGSGGMYRACYDAILASLEFTFGRILHQFPCEVSTDDAELRVLLDTLYETTVRRLQRLLDAVHTPMVQGVTMSHPDQATSSSRDSRGPTAVSSSSSSTSSCSFSKRDLGSYMTHWLLMNWTNPYPDDEGMVQLAAECGVNATVVSNWLINARTRKWRPAIVKAVKLVERPASTLLEDSIRIFQGRPLRAVDGGDHHQPLCVRSAKRSRIGEL